MNIEAILNSLATGAAIISLPGSIELAQLTVGALLPARAEKSGEDRLIRLAVVIPAHNEQAVLANCIDSLLASGTTQNPDDVFVIADNCTDETANIARAKGVSVLERHDEQNRGKGFALEFAFNYLRRGYEAFVVLDADSVVPTGFLDEFRLAFSRGAQAVQCIYLVANPEESNATRLMDLSLRAFNKVRPAGRQRWGQSVGILGNGFALSRSTLETVPYTASSVVEDLEYHLALLRAGIKVELLSHAQVSGLMPNSNKARSTQRARWEGGRLRMIRESAPKLLLKVLSGRTECIEPLLDLLLLPLSFHALLLAFAAAVGTGTTRTIGLAGLAVLLLHIYAAIVAGSSPNRDLRAIASVPGYILWKLTRLPMILAASLRGAAWVRTERPVAERPVKEGV
jgi:cellulose synthase/poly-beta-1,6-N-acetylglucosamine synthase-like glycosyltransferase